VAWLTTITLATRVEVVVVNHPNELWQEWRTQVKLTQSILVIDDWALDKPYARNSNLKVIRSIPSNPP
jgi:hypothetical protein